ncbi:MAG: hypothetical protein U0934_16070 [Pseudotabrizicola sp.]|uniref:hypothetical protein n=1 Tax=Pseudotabrizicola sp. TaxID=2939647 RepID=UPI00271D820C|nr:hypothetical protein [Pseudotabrizicola sp.]MDO8882587.1 hypothetical protein [Pseudotabrizicola sp.]MDP2080000.1 hypothetical protein [Pseudotabrizicola sp.]MDZ7575445.1 hypothetical protein [Pseudotabrizicola sp.]
MTYALSLLQKFGLFAPKHDVSEVFDLRLTRIGSREARCKVRATLFVRTPA